MPPFFATSADRENSVIPIHVKSKQANELSKDT